MFYRFLLYEVRPATSHEVNAIDRVQLLYTETRFKKTVRKVLVDLKRHQNKLKEETDATTVSRVSLETWLPRLYFIFSNAKLIFQRENEEKISRSNTKVNCNNVQVKPGNSFTIMRV